MRSQPSFRIALTSPLDVLAAVVGREQIARVGVMPAGAEGPSDDTGELAGDEDFHGLAVRAECN
jgi:hypothetical protein